MTFYKGNNKEGGGSSNKRILRITCGSFLACVWICLEALGKWGACCVRGGQEGGGSMLLAGGGQEEAGEGVANCQSRCGLPPLHSSCNSPNISVNESSIYCSRNNFS